MKSKTTAPVSPGFRCDKLSFSTQKEAYHSIHRRKVNQRFRTYYCSRCLCWHNTSRRSDYVRLYVTKLNPQTLEYLRYQIKPHLKFKPLYRLQINYIPGNSVMH